MNPANAQLQKISELIQSTSSGIICLPENAGTDAVAAGTALYLGLQQLGKNVTLASSGAINSELLYADKIIGSFSTSGENLVISFPYTDGSVEKVDYFIQGNQFNIVIVPGAGTEKLKREQVKYSYAGGDIQFIITIDTPSLKSLGQLYTQNQEQFKGKKIINIDRHVANSFYGTVNFVSKTTSSNVELIMAVLTALKVQFTKEMATNLYAGILAATQNFTAPGVNPQTFEAGAYLMKAGAGHGAPSPVQSTPQNIPQPHPNMQPLRQQRSAQPVQTQQVVPNPFAQKGADRQAVRTVGQVEKTPASSLEGAAPNENEDDEWLKPNIFKPGELL